MLGAGLFGGSNVFVAVLIGIAVGALVGVVNGYLIAFRALEPFIVTLGMLSLARGLVYVYTQGMPMQPSANDFATVANVYVLGIPVEFLIWVSFILVVAFVLRHTVFGRRVYAVGSSADASRAAGVPVRSTLFLVYVISGMLSGLAGFLLAAQVEVGTPTGGNLYELTAIRGSRDWRHSPGRRQGQRLQHGSGNADLWRHHESACAAQHQHVRDGGIHRWAYPRCALFMSLRMPRWLSGNSGRAHGSPSVISLSSYYRAQ